MAQGAKAAAKDRSRTGGRPNHKTQKRRQEILDEAAKVFFEKGYDAASTQDIADAVGILKGSLYYYVDSKEQFLYEIVKEAHDLGLEILAEVNAYEADAIAKLTRLIQLHVKYFADNLVKVNVFFREFRALSPEYRKDINELGLLYRDCVERLVREGQQDGSISSTVDPDLAGIMIVEMLNSISRWYHEGGIASADHIADQAADLLLAGVASETTRNERGGDFRFRTGLVRPSPPAKTASRRPKRR